MSRMTSGALKLAHQSDLRKDIHDAVGDLSAYEVHGPRVLVAVYRPGEKKEDVKTAGGIIVPHMAGGTLDEYNYQGRACLVLKLGPLAFKDDETNKFQGDNVKVGDWVTMAPLDGRSIQIGKQLCRLVLDSAIEMTIPEPDGVL